MLAAAAVIPKLEGRAFGRGTVGHAGVTAAHLDLIQGAVILVVAVIGAAGHRALDTGIGILVHDFNSSF